jgi:hypothetical protein
MVMDATLSQDFWNSGEERIHTREWEDELIYWELENGLCPWIFAAPVKS